MRQRFDVTKNLEKFYKILETKQAPKQPFKWQDRGSGHRRTAWVQMVSYLVLVLPLTDKSRFVSSQIFLRKCLFILDLGMEDKAWNELK